MYGKGIALWGARSNNAGLGNQSWEFFRHMGPMSTVVIDISRMDKKKVYPERYLDGDILTVAGFPSDKFINTWLDDRPHIRVLFMMETAYNYNVIKEARARGIVTVLQYNYEFLDYMETSHPFPDVLLAPSPWNLENVRDKFGKRCRVTYLPVPYADDRILPKNIKKAVTFLHTTGFVSHADRNGTNYVLDAIPLVKNEDVRFKIFSPYHLKETKDPRVSLVRQEIDNYWELYEHGDVLLMPRRYGGLCLPCQEAMGCGMPVIMPDISPNYTLLHPKCLFQVDSYETHQLRCGSISIARIDPVVLAAKIDEIANLNSTQLDQISRKHMAAVCPWSEYAQIYTDFLMSLTHFEQYKPKETVVPSCASKEGEVTVKVRLLRPWMDISTMYSKGKEMDLPLKQAKKLESQGKVVILSGSEEISG